MVRALSKAECIVPVTCIDERVALVMIDLQKGILRLLPDVLATQLVANSRQLPEAFRVRDLPVVAVNVAYSADLADAPAGRVDVRAKVVVEFDDKRDQQSERDDVGLQLRAEADSFG